MNEVLNQNLAQMQRLEELILGLPDSFTDEDNEHIQTRHHWAPGIYIRTLFRKAGVLIVGKQHRHSCLTVLLSGHLVVTSSTDTVRVGQHFSDGDFWISPPGAKRATYALEDSTLMTVHANPTDTHDLAELEAMIILPETELLT
jgi:hypothetical protein